jgi:hypothetical protein
MTDTLSQFRTEVRHFFLISLLNLVFAALAISYGVQFMVTAILGGVSDPATTGFRIFSGVVAMTCFGLGISWLLLSLRIFEGIETIKDDLDREGTSITDERLTCLIVRMLVHYRDNRGTVEKMICVCTAGGCGFFILGIATSLEAFSITTEGTTFALNNLLVIPAILLTLGIALASLISSWYFSKFTRVWDRRIHEIEESECALKKTLGLDEQ